jgi:hypothetical protein
VNEPRLKLRTRKKYLFRAIQWYTNELYNEFGHRIITPAVEHQINEKLLALQAQMCHNEKDNVWRVPVGIVVEMGTNRFEVVVKDESNILYLDEFNF